MLAGCSLAPKYERPAAPVAANYPAPVALPQDTPAEASAKEGAADLAWSQFFGDARLQRLIALALENNRDLRVADLRVDRVRALYNIQRTALIPSLDATGDAVRQRTPGDINGTGQSRITSSYALAAEIPSYELDFFGRVASLRDEVLQQYLATDEARHSAQIGLIAVARQYFALLASDEQLALAQQTLAATAHAYDLNRQSFDAGVTSELDLKTSEGQRETVRASVAAFAQQQAQAANALTLLIGAPLPPDLPPVGSLATQQLIENLPVGLPSDLLARRPDIRAAEHTLQAANADIGIARAALFRW